MGVGLVQIFGDLSQDRRARGWMTVEDLYASHRVQFDPERLLKKVAERLRPN
jgi:hypothetical protein